MVYQVGSPAMFDGNMFLPETGTPIWKMRTEQDEVRRLAARAVDGGDLDAEVVDDPAVHRMRGPVMGRDVSRSHSGILPRQ